jgi:3-(3-hydroxy-phenyl)propionate hydroxylase
MEHPQVIVAGAGPVGVLNALGLARAGVEVTVLERGEAVAQSPRAMVYHWSVLDGLERLGVYDDAVGAGFLKQDYAYRLHRTGDEVRYGLQSLEGLVRHPHNLHLGQNVLVEVALRHLAAYPHARVLWGHEVTGVTQDDDGVRVTAATGAGDVVLRADWLVAADGARSAVRDSLGIAFEGMTWSERFVATNIRFPLDERGWSQTTMVVDDVYGAVVAKIDNTEPHGLWRYTYCEDAALPEQGVLDRMPAMFQEVFGDADAVDLVAFSPYRMHQRAAVTFRAGRVLLAGDAAHATNPTGGLGLTSGLFDTYVLQEALAAVVHGTADVAVLDEYARERRRVFVDVVNPAASNNKRFVYHSSDPDRLARDWAELKQLEVDPEAAVRRLLFPKSLETRSLLGAW